LLLAVLCGETESFLLSGIPSQSLNSPPGRPSGPAACIACGSGHPPQNVSFHQLYLNQRANNPSFSCSRIKSCSRKKVCSSVSNNQDEIPFFPVASSLTGQDPFHGDSYRNIAWHREKILYCHRIGGIDRSKVKGILIKEQGIHIKTESYRLIESAFRFDAHSIADRITGTRPCFHRGHYQGK